MRLPSPLVLFALLAAAASCDRAGEAPPVQAPEAVLRRLTQTQYENVVHDLLGDDVVVPRSIEPDLPVDGQLSIGASYTTISPRGVENYERAAYGLAEQAVELHFEALLPCTPTGTLDSACTQAFVESFGRLAWRRPLDSTEVSRLVAVAELAAAELDDFEQGLVYAIAAMLQSPNFLFRVELGEGEQAGPLGPYALASRLSFFLWNRGPDEPLLDAAGAGELSSDEGLRTHAERMLNDPRAREGLRAFFHDMLQLDGLDRLVKDPIYFEHMSAELGPSAREQTLSDFEHLVFDAQGDYRSLFTSRLTHIDRKLASIYRLPAPSREGFALAELPDDGTRRGLLGHASLLSLHAHATRSSATLRGKFIRNTLLCQIVPPPPVDIDASIPEPSPNLPTLRDRVAAHLEVESCAACHILLDPLGLGLENFDGIGRWRTEQNGAVIEPYGDVDGELFDDAWQLGQVLADSPQVTDCFSRQLYRYGSGHVESDGEELLVQWLGLRFDDHRFRVQELVLDIVLSQGFRASGQVGP